jgi:DNA invertase Pin-like site-specific DNA recombinase
MSTSSPAIIPCVCYSAKSTLDPHGSIPTQIEDVKRMAEREGWTIIADPEQTSDENKSAWHGNRGRGLELAKRLAIAAAGKHGRCILVAQDADRFARGAGDAPGAADHLAELFFAMRRQGVELWTVRSYKLDPMRAVMEGERATDESSRKSQAVTAGIKRTVDKGKPFGRIPCGYRIEKTVVDGEVLSRRVIDPERAQIVETICQMIEAGESWGVIARTLNDRGWRTRRTKARPEGGPWTGPVVRELVKLRLYMGEKGYPQLIDPDRWKDIQKLISDNAPTGVQRRKGGRPVKVDGFLLRSLAFCPRCSSPMYVRSDSAGYYTCKLRRTGTGLCDSQPVPARLADERVFHHLGTFVGSVEAWIADRVADHSGEHEIRQQAFRREVAKLAGIERLRSKLMTGYEQQITDDRATAYLALEAVQRKDRELTTQQKKIADTEAKLAEFQGPPDVDRVLDYYNGLLEAIRGRVAGAESIREVNAALSTIIAAIWLSWDRDQLDASFALRPSLNDSDHIGGLAQVFNADMPGARWALHPPLDGPAPIESTHVVLATGKTYDQGST